MHRRTFVVTASTATAIGLAGCIGGGGGGGSDSPEGAAEAYFSSDSADDARDHLHPDSVQDELANESTESSGNESDAEVEVMSTNVVAEDIDGSYLEEEEKSPSHLSIEDVNNVAADEEVTLVEVTISISSEQGSGEFDQEVLTATDGGDWFVLDTVTQSIGF